MPVPPEDSAFPWAEEPARKSRSRAGIWIGATIGALVLVLTGLLLFLSQGPGTPVEVVEALAASETTDDMKAFTCTEIVEDAEAFVKYSTAVSLMISDAENMESLDLKSTQNSDGTVVVTFVGAFTISEWLVEEQDGDWLVCAWSVKPLAES